MKVCFTIKKLWIFLGVLLLVSSCRSPQMTENIADLETKMNTLNRSKIYWSDSSVDEIVELRNKAAALLLEEANYQKDLGLKEKNNDALYKAGGYYFAILRIAGKSYAVTDLEIVQKWPLFESVYNGLSDKGRHDVAVVFFNLFPITAPVVWVGEVFAFVADVIAGWRVVEETREIPPLADVYITQAEMGLAVLENSRVRIPYEALNDALVEKK